MQIELKEITKPDMDEIIALYQDAVWMNYTENPDMLAGAYQHSLKIIGAYDADKLVGIIRAVGDGYSILYIQDIIVLKAYRRRGVGSTLVREMMSGYSGVYQTVLLTDDMPQTRAFYRSLGFTADSDLGCMAFMRQLKQNERRQT